VNYWMGRKFERSGTWPPNGENVEVFCRNPGDLPTIEKETVRKKEDWGFCIEGEEKTKGGGV